MLIYTLGGGASVVVRPSGTEPKIKTYFTTLGKDLAEAEAQQKSAGRRCGAASEISGQIPLAFPSGTW